ncbi:MAG: hypothetical protein Ct9H300mP25_17790 [Acidobacteriota bacterium]|nr:MAG: hypothetical protein Ct9H300mP25_17790 [Acidobacteriota bacterium]
MSGHRSRRRNNLDGRPSFLGLAAVRYPASRIPWNSYRGPGWDSRGFITGFGLFMAGQQDTLRTQRFKSSSCCSLLQRSTWRGFNFEQCEQFRLGTMQTYPNPAKLAGATSLLLWIGVLLAGRWTGTCFGAKRTAG